ncbi:hypothetical protein [Paenibacillus sp. O199]|uniref:hypothetical protein n=1 Tax=Paenibacillus sp. O199 TaxID=1643925 RepID=UPI0007BEB903|nr:hypothetical protein [Paenibacillus sp. O199]
MLNYIRERGDKILCSIEARGISIDKTVDLESIAKDIFKQKKSENPEFMRYNVTAWNMSFEQCMSDLELFLDEHYFLTENIMIQINFIDKLIFDVNDLLNGTRNRRKKILAGLDLFPLYEETIRGYTISEFAKPSSSIFFMRQIIELKLKRAIGIRQAYNKSTKKYEELTMPRLIEFYKKLERKELLVSPVSLDLLRIMIKASNHYIHTGEFNEFFSWHEKIGQMILRELCFKKDERIQSMEGTFIIDKRLDNTMEKKIKEHFNWGSSVVIEWENAEATIINRINNHQNNIT